jgi:lauroyl/myristoyl acyltransferase
MHPLLSGFLDLVLALFWHGVLLLPERAALKLAPALGILIRTNTRRRTLANIRTVLDRPGDLPGRSRAVLPWRLNATHVARTLIELIHLERNTLDKLRARVSVAGEEHLLSALSRKRGVMLFLNHLGNIGYTVGGLAGRGADLTVIGNPVWIPFLERRLQHLHRVIGARRALIGAGLPQTAAQVLRQNGIFATFIDYTVVEKHNVWIRLGEGELSVNLGPAIIALRNGAEVLCVDCLTGEGGTHQMTIHPPLATPRTGELQTDAVAMMTGAISLFERSLLENPEQWWTWNHAAIRRVP